MDGKFTIKKVVDGGTTEQRWNQIFQVACLFMANLLFKLLF